MNITTNIIVNHTGYVFQKRRWSLARTSWKDRPANVCAIKRAIYANSIRSTFHHRSNLHIFDWHSAHKSGLGCIYATSSSKEQATLAQQHVGEEKVQKCSITQMWIKIQPTISRTVRLVHIQIKVHAAVLNHSLPVTFPGRAMM